MISEQTDFIRIIDSNSTAHFIEHSEKTKRTFLLPFQVDWQNQLTIQQLLLHQKYIPAVNDFPTTFTGDILQDFTAMEEAHSMIVTKETEHGTVLLSSKRNRVQFLSEWSMATRLRPAMDVSHICYFCTYNSECQLRNIYMHSISISI